jgi:hypothetical protein
MTNATLRQRFGIAEENYSMASRVIRDAIDDGWIKGEPRQHRASRRKLHSFLDLELCDGYINRGPSRSEFTPVRISRSLAIVSTWETPLGAGVM